MAICLKQWQDIYNFTNLCKTTLLLRKDFKFDLRARKAYIYHRRNINIQDKRLPLYFNGTYWRQRICLDDSVILGAVSYNGNIPKEVWVIDHPWVDYTTKLSTTNPTVKEVHYSNRQWCIFPLGCLGLPKIIAVANKRGDYYYRSKRQRETLIIPLNKIERMVRLQYIKAFRGKLYELEKDFMPWAKHRNKLLRNILKQRVAGRQKILRNGKMF